MDMATSLEEHLKTPHRSCEGWEEDRIVLRFMKESNNVQLPHIIHFVALFNQRLAT